MSSPPFDMPLSMAGAFTMNFSIPVFHWYIDDSIIHRVWTREMIETYRNALTNINIVNNSPDIEKVLPFRNADRLVLECLQGISLFGKSVAVVGSLSNSPWLEAILLNNGARDVTVVDYNPPEIDGPIQSMQFRDFESSSTQYDYIFSYSFISHLGLGRYGDEVCADADIQVMKILCRKVKRLLFLATHIGIDSVVWNAHRIYGAKRLPLLLEGYDEVKWIGFRKDEILDQHLGQDRLLAPQPFIVLRKRA